MLPADFKRVPRSVERPLKALLAEDEFLIRLDQAESMRIAGWEVVEVPSADDAMALLRHNVEFDLLVTDIRMPGHADGLDLARYVRAHHVTMKVVIVSSERPMTAEGGSDFDLFLTKPVWELGKALSELADEIRGGSI